MKILFVCTGNTCRSCMAEYIFNYLCNIDEITAFSAGISIAKDSKTSKNAVILIKKNINIDLSKRKAVQLTKKMIDEVDLILTMTYLIKDILVNNFNQFNNKIYTLNEYVGIDSDIFDPYGGDINVYTNTFKQLEYAVKLLIKKLRG